MEDVYLEPELKGRGIAVVKNYEDDDGYISTGTTNEASLPKLPVVVVNFSEFRACIVAGKREYDDWVAIAEAKAHNNRPNRFMWTVLFRALLSMPEIDDGAHLKTLMKEVRYSGYIFGRNSLRRDLNQLMKEDH